MHPLTDRLNRLVIGLCLVLSASLVYAQGGSYEDSLNSARMGDTRQLSTLLARGIDPDTVDAQGNSLLILAAREGYADTVASLLQYRPKLGWRNLAGDSALMLAVLKGHEKVVDLLLEAGAPLEHDGWAPLHYAAFEGRLAILDKLLARGAKIDALTPNRATALMLAARNGHIDAVRRLLRAGADTALKNDRGLTAAAWARTQGNTDIAELIERAGRGRR